MIKLFIFGLCIFAFFICVPLRLLVLNLFKSAKYAIIDMILYFKQKRWNNAKVGFIYCFTGLFGAGKTLSAVHYVREYYYRYNGRYIFDIYTKRFVQQYVQVLSNVELDIPYTKFVSMDQIVEIADTVAQFNEQNNCKLITIVLGDEFSVQMNSRNFKTNLPASVLNSILTCRHHGISLVLTSQRFAHMDALLRQVTSKVIECNKIWRLQCQTEYDAWDLEQAGSSLKLKPLSRGGWFVKDEDYDAYNSAAVVDNLIKDYKSGALLDEETILRLQGSTGSDENGASSLSKRYRKKRKVAG